MNDSLAVRVLHGAGQRLQQLGCLPGRQRTAGKFDAEITSFHQLQDQKR